MEVCKIRKSRKQFTKLCDWSSKNLLAVVFNQGVICNEGRESFKSELRILLPIDKGVKVFGYKQYCQNHPYIDVCSTFHPPGLHRCGLIRVEWDRSGQMLCAIDEGGGISISKIETITSDISVDFMFQAEREICAFLWNDLSRVWIFSDEETKRIKDILSKKRFQLDESLFLHSSIRENTFKTFKKLHSSGIKCKLSNPALMFLDIDGKIYFAQKLTPQYWSVQNVNIFNLKEENNQGECPEIFVADLCACRDDNVLVAFIYKSPSYNFVPRLWISSISCKNGANLESIILTDVELSPVILRNAALMGFNPDKFEITKIIIFSKSDLVIVFMSREELCDSKEVSYISAWNINGCELTHIKSRAVRLDSPALIQKLNWYDAFVIPIFSQISPPFFMLAIGNKINHGSLILSVPDLNDVSIGANWENEADVKDQKDFMDFKYTAKKDIKMCYPINLCSQLDKLEHNQSRVELDVRDVIDCTSFSLSPNGVVIVKFLIPDTNHKSQLNKSKGVPLIVYNEPLFLNIKLLKANLGRHAQYLVINFILGSLILSLINHRDYQDLVNFAYELEADYGLNDVLNTLVVNISYIIQKSFPSTSSSLSVDGTVAALQISLCRYKYIHRSINFEILLQLQYMIEKLLSSFDDYEAIPKLIEQMSVISPESTESSIAAFAKFAKFKYETIPYIFFLGVWFVELCLAMLRNIHTSMIISKNLNDKTEGHVKASGKGELIKTIGIAALFFHKPCLEALILLSVIFCIIEKKLEFISNSENAVNIRNNVALCNLENLSNMFKGAGFKLSLHIYFLQRVLGVISRTQTSPEELFQLNNMILLYAAVPSAYSGILGEIMAIFHEYLESTDHTGGPNQQFSPKSIPSQADRNMVNSNGKREHKLCERLYIQHSAIPLGLWESYSSLPYPEIISVSRSVPMQSSSNSGKRCFVDIMTKFNIDSSQQLLVCSRCNHFSSDSSIQDLGMVFSSSLKVTKGMCLCGGIWRRVEIHN